MQGTRSQGTSPTGRVPTPDVVLKIQRFIYDHHTDIGDPVKINYAILSYQDGLDFFGKKGASRADVRNAYNKLRGNWELMWQKVIGQPEVSVSPSGNFVATYTVEVNRKNDESGARAASEYLNLTATLQAHGQSWKIVGLESMPNP